MKPALHHYLLAHTAICSAAMGVVGAMVVFLKLLYERGALIGDWHVVGWIVLASIPTIVTGYLIGRIFIWMMLGGVAARLQGWPFKVGDELVILAGKERGRTARVYAVWEPRGQVRLELGDKDKDSYQDVYCAVAVTRTRNTGQVVVADPPPARCSADDGG